MSNLKEISKLQQAYFQLEKIKAEIDALSDFLVTELESQHPHKPKTKGMMDPRTNLPFRKSGEQNG